MCPVSTDCLEEHRARYVPCVDDYEEGARGTLCAPGRPMALVTLRNVENDPFPGFSGFSGFSVNSGGPSLPSWPECTERSKVARMATLRLLDRLVPLEPWPAWLARVVHTPYSWPPDLARTARFWPWPDSRRPYCSKAGK